MWPDVILPDGFWFFVGLGALLIAWRIWGWRVVALFDRIEQRRRDAELQAFCDRMNPHAHFRQTVDAINEETAAVEAFAKAEGAGDPRAVWNDRIFATRAEADAARWRHVLSRARDFYMDLDRMYGRHVRGRRGDQIGAGGEDEAKR
jgi:hypothetical protein